MNVFSAIKKRQALAYQRIRWIRWFHRCETKQLRNRIKQQRANFVFEPDNAFEAALFADKKVADERYADHLYCALENTGIYDLENNYITSYGQRDLGWLISDLRNEGIYLTYCWQHTDDDLTYIHDDLKRLGYKTGKLLSHQEEEALKGLGHKVGEVGEHPSYLPN